MIKIKNDLKKDFFFNDIKIIGLKVEDFNEVDKFLVLIKKISFEKEVKLCAFAKIYKSSVVLINNKEFEIETLQEIIDFFNKSTLSVLINKLKIKSLVEFKIGLEIKKYI